MSLLARIALAVFILLLVEAAGLPVVPTYLKIVQDWLLIWPAPTEHFASVLAAWAWPVAILVIVWKLRRQLAKAAGNLADRIETADLDIWGLSIRSKQDTKIPLNPEEARTESASFTANDVTIIERLYEFAGKAAENAGRLTDWITKNVDPELHPVDFLSEPVFAPERLLAYMELIGD